MAWTLQFQGFHQEPVSNMWLGQGPDRGTLFSSLMANKEDHVSTTGSRRKLISAKINNHQGITEGCLRWIATIANLWSDFLLTHFLYKKSDLGCFYDPHYARILWKADNKFFYCVTLSVRLLSLAIYVPSEPFPRYQISCFGHSALLAVWSEW